MSINLTQIKAFGWEINALWRCQVANGLGWAAWWKEFTSKMWSLKINILRFEDNFGFLDKSFWCKIELEFTFRALKSLALLACWQCGNSEGNPSDWDLEHIAAMATVTRRWIKIMLKIRKVGSTVLARVDQTQTLTNFRINPRVDQTHCCAKVTSLATTVWWCCDPTHVDTCLGLTRPWHVYKVEMGGHLNFRKKWADCCNCHASVDHEG